MRGDFSRKPFRRNLHDAGLLHQQGRVWLDGDWNENEFHRLDLNEQEAFDVIGPCGIPDDPTTPDDDDFYLVETDSALGNDDFRIHAGRAYVDGLLVVLDHDTTYKTQPDLLDPPKLVTSVGDRRFGAVVYLEVWRRLITYLEDDTVREKALEGPDTVARLKTLGQIKVVPVLTNPDRPLTCANAGDHLPKPGSGTLSTDQPDDADPEDPCRLPDDALFTGRENRLYRVEIHDPGDIDGIQRPGEAISFSTTLAAAANAGDMTLTLSAALSKPQAFALLRTGAASITDDDGNTETLLVTAVDNAKLTLGKPLGDLKNVSTKAGVVLGTPEYMAVYNGAIYHFATAEHKDTFERDPAKYVPAFGGYCTYAASINKVSTINPVYWQIQDGRLLLQHTQRAYDLYNQDAAGNLVKADANWPGLVLHNGK